MTASFPHEINNPRELEGLIRKIGQVRRFAKLAARWEDGTWVVFGEPSKLIRDIELLFIYQDLKEALSTTTSRFLGQADSPETRKKIQTLVAQSMFNRGYTRNSVTLKTEDEASLSVRYIFRIEQGEPCTIERVVLPFPLPNGIKIGIREGSLCDTGAIADGIDTLRADLIAAGYYNVDLALDTYVYNADQTHLDVKLKGQLNHKITYDLHYSVPDLLDTIRGSNFKVAEYTQMTPENLKTEIIRHYKDMGYDDIVVTGPTETQTTDTEIAYRFEIDRGRPFAIKDIQFSGNSFFSSDRLLSVMGISFFNTTLPLSMDAISKSIEQIESLYDINGFWGVETAPPVVKKDTGSNSASLKVTIFEGKQRLLNSINFVGNRHLTTEELEGLTSLTIGYPLDKNKVIEFEEAIRTLYINDGYANAKVSVEMTTVDRNDYMVVNVIVKVDEGTRFRTGAINIVGLVETEPKVVYRELTFESGDWLSPAHISESKKKLMDLGIFKSVQIHPANKYALIEEGNSVDLTVTIQEGNAGSVNFGPGFDLQRGLTYAGEISHKNLFGTGRTASFRASFSEERQQKAINNPGDAEGKTLLGRKIGAGYLEPHIFDLPINGHLSVSHKATADAIWLISNSLELSLGHDIQRFLPGSTIEPFYRIKQSRDVGSTEQADSLVTTGESQIGSIGVRYFLDKRDNISWPLSGFYLRAEVEWARYYLLGEFNYFRWDINHSQYFYLTNNLVLALGLGFTSFEQIQRRGGDNSLLPSTDRLTAGGVDQIRGFEQELGPYVLIDGGKKEPPLGGTRRTISKVELRHKPFDKFGTTVFVDSGNTFFAQDEVQKFSDSFAASEKTSGINRSIEDNNAYEFRDLLSHPEYFYTRHYISYGFSLNYITPLGPLRIALAWPMHEPVSEHCKTDGVCFKRENENPYWLKRYKVEFNIGSTF